MQVEKFVGSDMRQAMAKVREAFGNDAVILGTRRIDDVTEITAARDYVAEEIEPGTLHVERALSGNAGKGDLSPVIQDMQLELGKLRKLFEGELAQLAWRDMGRNQPNRFALINRLELAGIDKVLSSQITEQVLPCDDVEIGWRKSLGLIGSRIKITDKDLLQEGGVIALVGSTGVGKTTTAAKIAARFANLHGRKNVAFISTDNNKVGGQEQLVSFGSILGIPVQFVGTLEEMQRTLDSLAGRKLVVIDTAGMGQRDMGLAEQMAMLSLAESRIQPLLVIPATARASIVDETITAYARFKPTAAILTKLDECDALGSILSSVIRHKLPLAFTTNGQKVPDDLHAAVAQTLLAEIIRTYKLALSKLGPQDANGALLMS
jgi:flagellar biosynthesis protein FlhF